MSLLDTIKGAREEAEANSLRSAKKNEGQSDEGGESSAATGFSKRSTARAKPKRELAGTVRISEKSSSEMSKEEKKAAKDKRREEEDLIYDVKKSVLEEREDYRHTQRIWWGLVIVGIVCTVISWLTVRYAQAGHPDGRLAGIAIASMVLAYVLIIGAFIYDLVKVRPLRKEADQKIMGMSKRRMRQVQAESAERRAAKKAKK